MVESPLDISAGILSWRAPKTLSNTLRQYRDFPSRLSEFKLFFQECSDEDRAVAERYGIPSVGRKTNIGIQNGIRWVVESLTSRYVIFLENDFNLTVSPESAVEELEKAKRWIESGKVDLVRLRSLFNPGEPCADPEKYSKVFKPVEVDPRFLSPSRLKTGNPLVRLFRPFKCRRIAARGAYVERYPEKVFPRVFSRDETGLVTDSRYLNWTNNPVLISRELFLRIIDHADAHPSSRTVGGFQDLEKPLNCRWWRAQRIRIGLIDGIFTHNRLDR